MSKTIDLLLIGKSIKALRLERHLTQEQLADLLGCTTRSIRRYEAEGTTNIAVVNEFAERLGVSALDILDGDVL